MDIRGALAGQEDHGRGHFFRCAHPPRRDAREHRCHVVGVLGIALRGDGARCDGVDPHTVGPVLGGPRLGQRVVRRLGSAVQRGTVSPIEPVDRTPSPRRTIGGARRPVSKNGATTLVRSDSSNASSPTSAVGVGMPKMPALLIRMSIRPPADSTAASTTRRISAWPTPRSPATKAASPPTALISATTSSPRALSRPVTTTKAPAAANALAMDFPRPPVEPVTSAVRPASRVSFEFMTLRMRR